MSHLAALLLALGVLQSATPQPSLSQRRGALQPDLLITTLSAEELAGRPQPLEHDTEVARHEAITIVLTIAECEKASAGSCNASADIVAYTPDGTVHSEIKGLSLNERRATAPLKLAASDATGLYKIVATVRDLNARRFASAERIFGVK